MNLVGRAACGLDAPKRELYRMRFPVAELWIHHSVTNPSADPCADWRYIQDIHFGNGWADVGYSYGIHPRGDILEGRGDFIGAHTEGRNSKSLGVVLIGDYRHLAPTAEQVVSFRQLVHWLEETGRLTPAPLYPSGGHQNAPGASTVCPGPTVMARLDEFRVPWAEIPPAPGVLVPAALVVDRPIVATIADPQGRGYWQATSDGGVFTFSLEGRNLPFWGSMGGTRLNAPIVDMDCTPDGQGYWLVAEDGGVFNFGNAPFKGSRGGAGDVENAPTIAIESAPDGQGYWLTTADGGLFAFGSAFFAGRADYRGS